MAKQRRRILEKLHITEISGVDKPCQEGAVVTLMKRDQTIQKAAPKPKLQMDFTSAIAEMQKSIAKSLLELETIQAETRQTMNTDVMKRADEILAKAKETSSGTTFTAEERQRLADKGAAMPDGSFPIRNAKDLMDARRSIGRTNPSRRPAVIAHIKRRAKALGVDLPEGFGS